MSIRVLTGLLLCACPREVAVPGTVLQGGPVSGVWTRAASPYYLTGDAVIRPGGALVIEAGVRVLGSPGRALTVHGVLTARGSPTEPVLFTAADTAFGWHGIHFVNARDGSRLLYCTISWGRAFRTGTGGQIIETRTRSDSLWDQHGGGVFAYRSGPVFEYCRFTGNAAFGGGGALYADGGRSIVFRHCSISSNKSVHWGGGGLKIAGSTATLDDCVLEDNVAVKWTGGGMYALGCRLAIRNSTFRGNSAYGGGGLFLSNDTSAVLGCTIAENSAKYGGGIECNERCGTTVTGSSIRENTADYGGGIAVVEDCRVSIDRCAVTGNLARVTGGGVFLAESGVSSITASTVSGNLSEQDGGGITCLDVEPTFQDVLLLGNGARGGGGGLCLQYVSVVLRGGDITQNFAGFGGGIYLKNCPGAEFSRQELVSLHRNTAREAGADLFVLGGPPLTVVLDTFTVDDPGDLHAYPAAQLRIEHRHTSLAQVRADIHVSPEGDDSRSGLSPAAALRTLAMALARIVADSLHPRTIHLSDGEYPAPMLASPYGTLALRFISFAGPSLAELTMGPGVIIVRTPWWKQWWALALAAAALGISPVLGYRAHLRRVRMNHMLQMEHVKAEHLTEVDRLKSRFFANISHELRTPLTLIIGPTDLAMEETREPVVRRRLTQIRRNAQKLHEMINQILDFSRLEAGEAKLAVRRGEAVAFVNRIVQGFQSWAERKRITLAFSSSTDRLEAWFDPDKLEKILNNLISNALKFTGDGGRIDVALKSEEGRLGIEVSDTGCGIPGEHLPHVFDRFYRIDESHKTEGTGIGLALTRELVGIHHGAIVVRSEQNRGTVFTVDVPAGEDAYTEAEKIRRPVRDTGEGAAPVGHSYIPMPEDSGPEEVEPGEKPIVLVVEDNAEVRAHLREHLAPGYTVLEADNGRRALDECREVIPEIVVSDVMMPELDGYELARALRKDERTCHIPVILLTARAATESRLEGLETGADDYLTKPFEVKELLARMRNLIELRRTLRRRFGRGVELKPGEVAAASLDDEFLKRVMEAVEKNMGREDFSVDELAHAVFLSRMQLYRKLVAVTNLPPSDFIRRMRLQRARDLLEKNSGSVAEVAESVGFSNHSHFARCFCEQFGVLPGEFRSHYRTHDPGAEAP